MEIRHAKEQDIDRIMEIYDSARRFMEGHGNPNQWGPTNWPPKQLIQRDIATGKSYVCVQENRIVGTFFFDAGEDIEPSYRLIEKGKWMDDSAYGVVHRLAGDGSVKGIGKFCLDWAYGQCGHLRVDTHGDNTVMQNLLGKIGFTQCGTVYVEEDDFPRLAYEKTKRIMSDEVMDIIRRNVEPMATLMAYYRCAIMEIETKFKVLNEQFSLKYDRNPIETIKSRTKSLESLAKKVRKKDIPLSMESIEENINDIAGVRVICGFPEDIYMLADCLLQQDDITLIEKKDYIKYPKENGYRSLHLIVAVPIFLKDEKKSMKVEVQLRTIAMDFWASLEHKIRYKKDLAEDVQEELAKELLYCADQSSELDLRMQRIRNKIECQNECI